MVTVFMKHRICILAICLKIGLLHWNTPCLLLVRQGCNSTRAGYAAHSISTSTIMEGFIQNSSSPIPINLQSRIARHLNDVYDFKFTRCWQLKFSWSSSLYRSRWHCLIVAIYDLFFCRLNCCDTAQRAALYKITTASLKVRLKTSQLPVTWCSADDNYLNEHRSIEYIILCSFPKYFCLVCGAIFMARHKRFV